MGPCARWIGQSVSGFNPLWIFTIIFHLSEKGFSFDSLSSLTKLPCEKFGLFVLCFPYFDLGGIFVHVEVDKYGI